MRYWINLLAIILCIFSLNVYAAPVDNSDVKNTCEVSGGTFTETSSGNWACCWSDWGCYGCVDGVCKIKCYNARCRRANGQSSTLSPTNNRNPKLHIIDGLAPTGMKAPVVPKSKMPKASAAPSTIKQ